MASQKWNPGRLLELSGGYWQTCALHAGVKLDLFTTIGNKTLGIEEIAHKLKTDKRGLAMLLNALTAMNLLVKTGGRYANTEESASFLVKDSSEYIGYIIMHHHHLVDSWSRLDQAVKTGNPVRTATSFNDEKRESFLMGMFNIAMGIAPRVVKEINIADKNHLLDLGGGPGTYAIHFCLHNPLLKATIYDLPTTRPFAQKTVEKYGLAKRIDFMDGNYVEGGIEGTYDAVWISHILHAEGPETCRQIIKKTVSVLQPGGMIILHDFILDNTMDGPLFPALFSLNMLLGTAAGQAYTEEQIVDMLAAAGIKEIQRIPFRGPSDSGIITGVV